MKAEALRRLAAERVFTTLAVAVAEGVNDHEVGAIAEYALATDFIAGVAFQPMFGSGRSNEIDPMRRATTTGTLRRLGAQTADRVGPDDFIALPCSHPDCSSITYFIRGDSGDWRSVPRLLGTEQLKGYLGLVSNRIAPDDAMWTALVGMMSETTLVSRPELIDHVLRICEACDLGVKGFVKNLGMWLFDRDQRGGGARPSGQALLGQDVHGRVHPEHRAAPAMLCPRRLHERRGEPRANPVLRPAALRRAAAPHLCRHGQRSRAGPARRRSSNDGGACQHERRSRRSGHRRTSGRRSRRRRSTSASLSRSAGWARSG